MNLLTPKQITTARPDIAKEWNFAVIGMLFYPLKLARGQKIGNRTVVDLDDIIQLWENRHTENKRY